MELSNRRRNNTNSAGYIDYLGRSIEQYQLYIPAGMWSNSVGIDDKIATSVWI